MNVIIIVSIILVTVSVAAAAVYFIITMIQLAKTAKEAEEALIKINYQMDAVGKVSSSVMDTLSFFSRSWVGAVTAVVPVFMSLIFKKFKK